MTLPLGFPGYDGIRRHGPVGRVVLGLGHLDHTQEMASYVPGTDELHKFLAGEHLTGNASGEVETVLDGEKREQNHQGQDLRGRELAVRSLGKVHLPLVQCDMTHHVHDSLDRLRIVTFGKIAVEFRNNMPIFVHDKGVYIELFGDTNIVIINEICNISQRNQP